MKKVLIVLALVLMATPAFAQRRGLLTNTYASWLTVSGTTTAITLPEGYKSRDISIWNGGSVDLFVNLKGTTIPKSSDSAQHSVSCCGFRSTSADAPSIINIEASGHFELQDYATESIALAVAGVVNASPVTVLITY